LSIETSPSGLFLPPLAEINLILTNERIIANPRIPKITDMEVGMGIS
jgi:hypothetical protein